MISRTPRAQRAASVVARAATAGSASMLALTAWGSSLSGVDRVAAATFAAVPEVVQLAEGSTGSATPITTGGVDTAFSFRLPTGSACTGDSANGDYRVQSYMVKSDVEVTTITFDNGGPMPLGTGDSFRQPLYEKATTSPYLDRQTANADTPGGPGPVVSIPSFSFGVFAAEADGILPAGTYNLGIACTKGAAGPQQLDKYWNTQFVITTDAAGSPESIQWTVQAPSSPATTTTTTSSTSTTSTTSATTTTTAPSSTTTYAPTTTAATDDATTTTASVSVLGASTSGGAPTSGSVVANAAQLPVTGGSSVSLVVWSVLLLVFGRMAILLGRTPTVRAGGTP